jgi:hypothetical protein
MNKALDQELAELEGPSDADVLAVEAYASAQDGDYATLCCEAWDIIEAFDSDVNSL